MAKVLVIAALWFPALVSAVSPELVAPDTVYPLLAEHVSLSEVVDATAAATSERRWQREVSELLATEGYFTPRVTLRRGEGGWRLEVDPGPRSLIGEVQIEIEGELDAERRQALVSGWPLKSGQPFRQASWDAAKSGLLADLLAIDFAAARITATRADVDPQAKRVDLRVSAETGPRYRFGELNIAGLRRYAPDLVARLNTHVKPGEPYREERLLALQAALQSTPYFASVSVTLDREAAVDGPSADGWLTAPVRVQIRERAPYQVSLGVGYSTNTGARVEGSFRNSDFLNRAWELQTGVRLEQLRQTAFVDAFLPPGERLQRDGVGVAAENSEIEKLGIRRVGVGATRVQRRGSIEQRLGVNWQREKESPEGAPATTNRALTAQLGWIWRHLADPLDPADGVSLQWQLGGASKQLLSDQNFVRGYLRYSQGVLLDARNALLFRGEVGATLAPSSKGIPQDFLFRTGGSNTVRGYPYLSLGVKEGEATVGGRYLLVMSAEYTHWLTAQWGAAVFVDAGNATDDWQAISPALGYGMGARWKSPAGPLGIDLAYGQRDGSLRLDFSLAIPF